jgi:hypothetical protein
MLRAAARHADLKAENIQVSEVFSIDAQMRVALQNIQNLHFVSVVDAVCRGRTCPLTVNGGTPLTWDYGHLTIEGSRFVISKIAAQLGLAGGQAKIFDPIKNSTREGYIN